MDITSEDDIIYIKREKGSRSQGRICCKCGSGETNKNSNNIPMWLKYYDDKGNWYRESYLCYKCWMHDYHNNVQKLDPNNTNNIIKSMSAYRIGIGKYTNNGFGILGEATIAKEKKLEICCLHNDNFNFKFDLLDPVQGRIQSKIRTPIYGNWSARIDNIHNFDVLYFLCANEQMENIIKVYVIPEEYIHDITTVGIRGNPIYGSKYDQFRLDKSEEKKYNDAFRSLIDHIRDKHKFTAKDIIKWLEI